MNSVSRANTTRNIKIKSIERVVWNVVDCLVYLICTSMPLLPINVSVKLQCTVYMHCNYMH